MAIGAQLDAANVSTTQQVILAASTSTELLEALAEDRTTEATTNEMRRSNYWLARLLTWQWQYDQFRRGLLPSFNEAGMARGIVYMFRVQRTFEGFWEGAKPTLFPEFVEWVEEQRAKAA